jgi:hypothetical protein
MQYIGDAKSGNFVGQDQCVKRFAVGIYGGLTLIL